MKLTTTVLSTLLLITAPVVVQAQNAPCSGKMGGVSHCKDGKFVCKNGKISKSKKVCR